MALTNQEVESLRFHLGYGNLDETAQDYTGDGFLSIFEGVVSPGLSAATETTATTSISVGDSGGDATVTPASMTGIVPGAMLVVDVADQAEVVVVRSVTATTFTAFFSMSHPSSGYPIGTLFGVTRLRTLLWQAERMWSRTINAALSETAGIKSLDKGDIVWFEGFRVMKDQLDHYMNIVCSISSLVRVAHRRGCGGGKTSQLEAY